MTPAGRSPTHPLYILRTPSCQSDGRDTFSVMYLAPILRFSMEIPNYIGILPVRNAHSLLPEGGVGHLFQAWGRA